MIRSIACATDFSPASAAAFDHALRLAVEFRSHLDLLHVRNPSDGDAWGSFPHVRESLARWGRLAADAGPDAIEAECGVLVRKVEIHDRDTVDGVVNFLMTHRPELLVVSTHGREGVSRILSGSVSESVARQTHIPTLFLGPDARPFVDHATGEMRLVKLLVPIAEQPSPLRALHTLASLLDPLVVRAEIVHVGEKPLQIVGPTGHLLDVRLMRGPVDETILKEAGSADLVAMPTAGHLGFLDALRGSTTERVLHHAPCPLLALPA
jgi:nucleotide-binding universal stress UspA family protein